MAEVFLSYAAEDLERIRPIAEAIEASGFSVWWDRRIGLGQSFDREIERELQEALCVVVVWSNASVESTWVREEADDGLSRNILVPVQIDDCSIPLGFRRIQAAQLLGWPKGGQDLTPVFDRIASCCGVGQPTARTPVGDKTTVVKLATLVLAIIGVGAAITFFFRASIITMLVMYVPGAFFGDPVSQEVGVTTTGDGTRIVYATSGVGSPVVYVLGWMTHLENGFNSPVYDNERLLSMTSAEHMFVRYDGRGFGLSDRDVEDLSIRARISDLTAVVDTLGLRRFAILAASSGGAPAIVFASENPERVTSLIIAGFGASDTGGHETNASRESAARMMDLFEVGWEQPEVSNMFANIILAPNGTEVEKQVLGELLRKCCSGPNVANYFRILGSFDVTEFAKRLSVPTLVINARDDQAVPLNSGKQLAALIPGAKFAVVEGGHREGTASTAEVRRLALDFVSDHSPDDG